MRIIKVRYKLVVHFLCVFCFRSRRHLLHVGAYRYKARCERGGDMVLGEIDDVQGAGGSSFLIKIDALSR